MIKNALLILFQTNSSTRYVYYPLETHNRLVCPLNVLIPAGQLSWQLRYKTVCFTVNTSMRKGFSCIHLDIFSIPYYRSSLIAARVALPSLGWDVLPCSTDVQETPLQNSSSPSTGLNPFCTETAYINKASTASYCCFSSTSVSINRDLITATKEK